jgi:hypothetical protein
VRLTKVAIVLVASALVAGLAGCGDSSGSVATDSRSSGAGTFTSSDFHFSVAYDPEKFSAHVKRDLSGRNVQFPVPGVGTVRGDMQVLFVRLTVPTSLSADERGALNVIAIKLAHIPRAPTLAAFGNQEYMRRLRAAGDLTASPQKVTLNGLPAYRYVLHSGGVTAVNYVVFQGSYIYCVNLGAPAKRWSSAAPAMNAVAKSFTVTL